MSYVGRGNQLTDSEVVTTQAIDGGAYFVYNAVVTGTVNGSNVTFTLPSTPNPSGSVVLTLQGQVLVETTDYSISGNTITMISAPPTGTVLKCPFYTVAP